jgi:hypothetical protein
MADAFTYKLTTESELFSFDFSQVLAATETISTASCSVLVVDGYDPSPPSNILSGSPSISGSKASIRVTGGVSEVTYRLVMTIVTSSTNTYTAVGDLPVYDPSQI